jgi:hypothetical protein
VSSWPFASRTRTRNLSKACRASSAVW